MANHNAEPQPDLLTLLEEQPALITRAEALGLIALKTLEAGE